MKHDEAMATVAAERYVLGELSETERAEFEEHYFSCPECAEDIRDLAGLTDGVRAGLAATKAPKVQRTFAPLDLFRNWFVHPAAGWAAACVMLLVTTTSTIHTMALRRQLQPEALHAWMLYPETRGEAVVIPAQRSGPFLVLEFDLPGAEGMLDWSLVRIDSKRVLSRGAVAAPPSGSSLKLVLPDASLAPGEYRIDILRRTASSGAWNFRFQIQGADK